MGSRAVAALGPHATRVVAVSTDETLASLGLEVRPDLTPGLGPLGGIQTALEWARELSLQGVLILACDLPLVSGSVVGALISAWRGEDAVAPLGEEGPEPLCALYALSALPLVGTALAEGERSPSRLLSGPLIAARFLPPEAFANESRSNPFLNVNTTVERVRAEEALRRSQVPPGRNGRVGP
jgi:molybdopterin-guanine dinucleotide biosynthesis protein A